ncbi:MAG: hypothetical protein AAC990_06735 [Dehalococcoides mccartyi]|uniref:Uncharacterized protein n=1 Tax=Dehalococcoides mccartyi (strain ATCC BAA-2266 / KCTC 15142 / 195) TaxID=243164 RepID=Q3Z8X8_DEHM1|nr:hypothetical protein [Dehalococcoides mccartyi]AAW40143.1 hypothetical protein DET0579 [Dehalococcoides mccartyi 195]MCF7634991.1 hypothetical protein [Dehalococcoides mccartyi]MDN4185839.1 hypothetical protein [Dehalococcoides mccartyi]MEA2121412.1 hypothetical protein [Dehalococcoides mccartyi]MEA2122597.1 hypothetical protein [Dehalococcoides mccartyi]
MDVSESIIPIIVGIVQVVFIVVLLALGIYSFRNHYSKKHLDTKDIPAEESREDLFF